MEKTILKKNLSVVYGADMLLQQWAIANKYEIVSFQEKLNRTGPIAQLFLLKMAYEGKMKQYLNEPHLLDFLYQQYIYTAFE